MLKAKEFKPIQQYASETTQVNDMIAELIKKFECLMCVNSLI